MSLNKNSWNFSTFSIGFFLLLLFHFVQWRLLYSAAFGTGVAIICIGFYAPHILGPTFPVLVVPENNINVVISYVEYQVSLKKVEQHEQQVARVYKWGLKIILIFKKCFSQDKFFTEHLILSFSERCNFYFICVFWWMHLSAFGNIYFICPHIQVFGTE